MMLQLFISPPRCTSLERLKAKVKGKTVLITGASFGIGEATALLLARAGAEVLLVARTEEKLASLAETIRDQGGKATVYVADLYKAQEVSRLVTTIKHDYPHIALIVSNAGKSIRRKITDSFGRDDLERCLALNFSSPAQLIMAFLPDMVQRGGHVISVSTVSVRHLPIPQWSAYQSSKTGFEVWFRGVATELKAHRVYMSSVYMPLVRTRMIAPTRGYDKLPALSPLEAAEVIAYAIVTQKERVAPWWLGWVELASLLLRIPVGRIFRFLEQRHKG